MSLIGNHEVINKKRNKILNKDSKPDPPFPITVITSTKFARTEFYLKYLKSVGELSVGG